MDGDLAPVADLLALAEAHDAWLMTDDADGIGVLNEGHGSAHRLAVPLQMGTFSKVVGGYGGYLCASRAVCALICLNLTRTGFGQSSFISIGGDPRIGTTTLDALQALDRDEPTDAVVLAGEIGGAMEEEAAVYASTMQKPVVAFTAGRAAPPARRMAMPVPSLPAPVAATQASGRRWKPQASPSRTRHTVLLKR